MTTPPDPFDAARLRASSFIRRGEQRVGRAWFRSLTRWMDRTRPQVLPEDAPPQPQNVDQNRAFWGELMQSEVIPEVTDLYTRVRSRVTGVRDESVTDPDAAAYLNEAGNRLVRLPDEVYSLIVREIENGIALGESVPDLRNRVQTVLTSTASERWPNRAVVVARTETMGAVNAGAYAGALRDAEERGDPAPFKVWLSTEDDRTRPSHVDADGQRTLLTEPFRVGGAPLLFPGDPRGPAQEVIQCFSGDVRVSVPSGLVAVFRRWYEGPMLRIQMVDGVQLPVTPNHPLLTESGWKAAERVQTGDQLCGTIRTPGVGPGEPYVDHAPATFHQLYSAAVKSGVMRRIGGSAVDFHGDGSDREVQVVFTDLGLCQEADTSSRETVCDEQLVRLCDGPRPLPLCSSVDCRCGTTDGTEFRAETLPGCGVSGCGPRFPLLGGGCLHAQGVGLTATAHGQAQFPQSPNDERAADPEMVRKAIHGLPGGMATRQVVKIDRYAFSGHVYNLQSVGGWYIANDTASGNCRCTFLPVTLGDPIDWTDRQEP